jgi:hypothetical protein
MRRISGWRGLNEHSHQRLAAFTIGQVMLDGSGLVVPERSGSPRRDGLAIDTGT